MTSLRPWIQVGAFLAIAMVSSSNAVYSDEATSPPAQKERFAAVSPDVDPQTGEFLADEKSTEALQPLPEQGLPVQSALPSQGEPRESTKPKVAIDLNLQFKVPIELYRQPAADRPGEAPRPFSDPPNNSPAPGRNVEEPAPQSVDPLLQLINEAIDVSGRRFLTADVHTPWQIIHGLLAYRQDFVLKTKDGRKVNALEWASSGVTFQGESLFQKTPHGGQAHPFKQPYWFEGHPTQFMAYLTMCRLPMTHVFKTADGQAVTVGDIINNAKMDVNREEEMTWTLWALAHYLEPDAQWVNKKGEHWSMEELVRIETASKVYDGPCGGTHGLFALSYIRNSYLQSRRPLRGVWLEADQKIQRFILEARSLQNSDGSFSIHFFKGPGYSDEFNARINSSGHMLEWLMVALPQSRLQEDWIQNGLRCLAQDLNNNRHQNAECGPLYHAVDGLQIYRERLRIAQRTAPKTQVQQEPLVSGWKPVPQRTWPQPKSTIGGRTQESDMLTTDVQTQTTPAPTKSIRIAPGIEIVVPRRNRPIQSTEGRPNAIRR